jgi:hypothetical protein
LECGLYCYKYIIVFKVEIRGERERDKIGLNKQCLVMYS